MRILVLADTHVRRGGSREIPRDVLDAAVAADVIIHAGDVVTGEVLSQLGSYAPCHAVLGNNDHELAGALPPTLQLDLDGLAVAVLHDSGPAAGRPKRLRRMFPTADVVVFGHSHLPRNNAGENGQWLLNPGSPTERRRAPAATFAWLEVQHGTLSRAELVEVR